MSLALFVSNENKIPPSGIAESVIRSFLIKLHNLAISYCTYISTYVPWQIDAFMRISYSSYNCLIRP